MTHRERVSPEGWGGRYFEDFEPGDIYYHPLGKTILEADNQWFTLLTQNTAKIHFDDVAASATEYGRPLVNSTFLLALVTGQSVIDLTFNVFANLGWDEVRMPAPVFAGDTISSRSKVLEKRRSASRPDTGIVVVATEGYNQDSTIVLRFRRTFLIYLRGHAPVSLVARPAEDTLPESSEASNSGM